MSGPFNRFAGSAGGGYSGEGVALGSITVSEAVDVGSIDPAMTRDATISVPGAEVGDGVVATPNAALETTLSIDYAYVDSVNSVTIRFRNHDTASALDPASVTYTINVLKH